VAWLVDYSRYVASLVLGCIAGLVKLFDLHPRDTNLVIIMDNP